MWFQLLTCFSSRHVPHCGLGTSCSSQWRRRAGWCWGGWSCRELPRACATRRRSSDPPMLQGAWSWTAQWNLPQISYTGASRIHNPHLENRMAHLQHRQKTALIFWVFFNILMAFRVDHKHIRTTLSGLSQEKVHKKRIFPKCNSWSNTQYDLTFTSCILTATVTLPL